MPTALITGVGGQDGSYLSEFLLGKGYRVVGTVPDDYVLATGETHSVRDLCEEAFTYAGLDYSEHTQVEPPR